MADSMERKRMASEYCEVVQNFDMICAMCSCTSEARWPGKQAPTGAASNLSLQISFYR